MDIPEGSTIKTFSFNHKMKLFHSYYEDHNRQTRDRCTVDILIPFHGNYTGVRKLVKSILEQTRSNPYQITLIDDASPNKEFVETMRQAPQTKCIRLNKQVGFGAALYEGFNKTTQPFVCILHSDCEIVSYNWLEDMGNTLFKLHDSNVRLVSARTDNSLSDIPELEGERGTPADDIIVDRALPLYAALFERNLFNQIGGFIKPYPFAGFENEELYWRMSKYGFKQAISGRSWVRHQGEGTIGPLVKKRPEILTIMNENRNRCLKDVKTLM